MYRRRSRSRGRPRTMPSGLTPGGHPVLVAPQPVAVPRAGPSPAGGVPDWLSDLFPGTPRPPLEVAQALTAPARPHLTSISLEIPLALTPLLTNGGSTALAHITEVSGADVVLRQELQHLGYNLAIITGTPQAAVKAKDMVMQAVGLGGDSSITKEIEVSGDPMNSISAVDLAQAELRHKSTGFVPIRFVHPRTAGDKGRVAIGPGPVAHVAVAETLVRKKLSEIELELCYRQGRPVPPELKIPVHCKFYVAGNCSLGGKCQYCHGLDELEVAQRLALPKGAEWPTQVTPSPSLPQALTNSAASDEAERRAAEENKTSETSALL